MTCILRASITILELWRGELKALFCEPIFGLPGVGF